MKISEDEVRYVAQLARLRLKESQIHDRDVNWYLQTYVCQVGQKCIFVIR